MPIKNILRRIWLFLGSSHFAMMMTAFAFSALWRRYEWYDVIVDTILVAMLVQRIFGLRFAIRVMEAPAEKQKHKPLTQEDKEVILKNIFWKLDEIDRKT